MKPSRPTRAGEKTRTSPAANHTPDPATNASTATRQTWRTEEQPTRTEPAFDAYGAGAPRLADSPYAQFETGAGWRQKAGPLRRNPLSRVLLMGAIFAIGAGVGLAATWWINQSDQGTQKPAVASVRKPPPIARELQERPGAALSGPDVPPLNPGELPYDGLAPALVPEPAESEPAKAAAPPVDGPAQAAPAATAPTLPQPRASQASSAPPPVQKPAAKPAAKSVPKPPVKVAEEKVAKPAPAPRSRPAASPPVPKDREIDRIQQQVDEELKKKSRAAELKETTRARHEEADRRADATSVVGDKRGALARCDRVEDSIIGREWCRWKVCSGMWGKNGCPSYEKQASSY